MATLPSSGALSMSAINAEFGRGNNLNSYRGTTWYTDAGASGTFSSGAISMNAFYGKRASAPVSFVNPLTFNGNLYSDSEYYASSIDLTLNSGGIWTIDASAYGNVASGSWATPNIAGIGAGKYVKFTLNSSSGSGGGNTGTTGWLDLAIAQGVGVSAVTGGSTSSKTRTANYTVQIATDSGGGNIVSTSTVSLRATAIYGAAP